MFVFFFNNEVGRHIELRFFRFFHFYLNWIFQGIMSKCDGFYFPLKFRAAKCKNILFSTQWRTFFCYCDAIHWLQSILKMRQKISPAELTMNIIMNVFKGTRDIY